MTILWHDPKPVDGCIRADMHGVSRPQHAVISRHEVVASAPVFYLSSHSYVCLTFDDSMIALYGVTRCYALLQEDVLEAGEHFYLDPKWNRAIDQALGRANPFPRAGDDTLPPGSWGDDHSGWYDDWDAA